MHILLPQGVSTSHKVSSVSHPKFCFISSVYTSFRVRIPLRLISYDQLQKFSEFPRFPDNADVVESLEDVDRDNAFIVFISHCWLAGWDGSDQWRGIPHPDNLHNEKFDLILHGLKVFCLTLFLFSSIPLHDLSPHACVHHHLHRSHVRYLRRPQSSVMCG